MQLGSASSAWGISHNIDVPSLSFCALLINIFFLSFLFISTSYLYFQTPVFTMQFLPISSVTTGLRHVQHVIVQHSPNCGHVRVNWNLWLHTSRPHGKVADRLLGKKSSHQPCVYLFENPYKECIIRKRVKSNRETKFYPHSFAHPST